MPVINKDIGKNKLTKIATQKWPSKFLLPFFEAITETERHIGNNSERLDQFRDSDGVFLQRYLMGLSGGKGTAKSSTPVFVP
jgi:hypothetical protein